MPNTSPFASDSWLAGFIDSDGGFSVKYSQKFINNKKANTKLCARCVFK